MWRPQDPQVLAAPSAVLLAAAAEFQNPAQTPLGDQVLDHLDLGAVTGLVGDGQLDVGTLAGLNHGVRLGQGPAHRFFQEDAGSVLGAGQHHVVVAVQPARSHAHDLGTLLPQHLPVVRVAGLDAQPGFRFLEPLLVLIGDGHQLRLVHRQPDGVQAVSVIASVGPADDRDPVFFAHSLTSQKRLGMKSILTARGESLTQHRDRGCDRRSGRAGGALANCFRSG